MFFQVTSAIPSNAIELLTQAKLPTQIVLGLLAVLSLVSWGIILGKWIEFRRMKKSSALFLKEFARATRLDQVAS